MPIGVLRSRAVDMVGDARSQDALLVLLLVLFYPGWLLPGWPDKSHCMVTSVLSNSLTKALPRSRHTGTQACWGIGLLGHGACLPTLDPKAWLPRQLIVALGQGSYRPWPPTPLYGECNLPTFHPWVCSPTTFCLSQSGKGRGNLFPQKQNPAAVMTS